METGKYALPASRSPCELKERGRKDRCLYRGLGRDGLHESADDRHFPETLQNVTTEEMTHAVDYCGVKSGKNENKFETAHLTPVPAAHIDCPMIGESPVSIECRVKEKLALGSHTLFIGEVVGVHVDESYVDAEGAFHFSDVKPIVYCHGKKKFPAKREIVLRALKIRLDFMAKSVKELLTSHP